MLKIMKEFKNLTKQTMTFCIKICIGIIKKFNLKILFSYEGFTCK